MCGATSSTQRIINVPLPAGTNGLASTPRFRKRVCPGLMISSRNSAHLQGLDAHREDVDGAFALEEDDYAWLTRQIVDLARRHARGRLVSILEEGHATTICWRGASSRTLENYWSASNRSEAFRLAALSTNTLLEFDCLKLPSRFRVQLAKNVDDDMS